MKARYLVLSILASLFLPQMVSAKHYACPENVTTKSSLQGLPMQWKQRAPYPESADAVPVTLRNVALYLGDPEEGAILKPEDNEKQNQAIYLFPSDQTDNNNSPWLTCEYYNTPIMATLPLPKGTKSCTVSYEPNGEDHSTVKHIECR